MSAVADEYNPGLQHPNPVDVGAGSIGDVHAGGQIKPYTTNPNTEGLKPDDVNEPGISYSKDGSDPTVYGWSVALQQWV